MATATAKKSVTKPSTPAAASKSKAQGEAITKPPTGEIHVSGQAALKNVTALNSASGAETQITDAGTPGTQLAITAGGEPTESPDATHAVKELTPTEIKRFDELNKLVSSGLKKMNQLRLQVAAALAEIRDKELYRGKFDSYEAFCFSELKLLKSHAHALAKAGEVYRDLESAMADKSKLPANERQLRPLTRLKLSKQRTKAWRRAIEFAKDKKITEAHVRKAVNEIEPRKKGFNPLRPPSLGCPLQRGTTGS